MHQRGESTDQKSRCPHITLRFEEAPLMRLSVGTLQQVVKRDLSIAFVPQQLTSYGGLELLRRYVRRIELPRRLQAAFAALGGDYGGARLALLLLALPYVGARRLEHLQYLVGDPLVRRFAGLARVPTARATCTTPSNRPRSSANSSTGSGAAWVGACRSSSAWMPRFSSLMCCGCSPLGAVCMPSRSATGAGCPSSSWPPSAGTGTRWPPA